MSFEIAPFFETAPCSDYCLRVADGTHGSPKESQTGKLLVTSKNVKGGRLILESAYLISEEDYAEINRRSKVDQWDLLLTMIGTVGEVCIIEQTEPSFAIKNVGLLKCGSELRAKWLYYFLRSPQGQSLIEQRKKGSTQQYISLTEIRDFPVSYPGDAQEMQVTVSLLSILDDRITLLRETNATLEAIAQALFKSWFVDFDPVRAKMDGRTPEGMDEATAALFPDGFETSELGEVPKGWTYCSLKEVCAIFDSRRVPLSGAERAKRRGPYPYYGAAAPMDRVDDYLFDGVYLLIGEDGSVANEQDLPITQYVWGKFWVNNHAHVLQGKAGMSTEHLMLALRRVNIQPYITGAVQAKLSQSNMWRINVLNPGHDVFEVFAAHISPLYEAVRANCEQSQTLSTLRDTLLPRLISGQLRLPEAIAVLEATP